MSVNMLFYGTLSFKLDFLPRNLTDLEKKTKKKTFVSLIAPLLFDKHKIEATNNNT